MDICFLVLVDICFPVLEDICFRVLEDICVQVEEIAYPGGNSLVGGIPHFLQQ